MLLMRVVNVGEKLPEVQVNHSTPSSVAVWNAWSFISTPPVLLHCVVFRQRDNFIFYFTYL
jgi:hypothetical protein